MKIDKIKEMSSPELEKELSELKTELFKLRFSLATNGLENPMKIKEVKKDIARINTILRQRELEEKREEEKRRELAEHPVCPMCGSKNTNRISTLNRAVSVGTLGLASSKIGKQYECKNCKHKW